METQSLKASIKIIKKQETKRESIAYYMDHVVSIRTHGNSCFLVAIATSNVLTQYTTLLLLYNS